MPGMKNTMNEFKGGNLHSGSKQGPKVTSRKQAIAIGLSQEKQAGKKVAPKKKAAPTDISTRPSMAALDLDKDGM